MGDNMSNSALRPETILAHALVSIDKETGAVVPPMHAATTFARDEHYETRIPSDYQRNGNPNLTQAEDIITALEQGKATKLFASGMAAVATLLETVPPGGHVVAQRVIYYGVRAWLQRLEQKGRISLTLVDTSNLAEVKAALQPGKTDMVWIETPSNPTWSVADISAIATVAHAAGAILVVDATVSAGVTTKPLALGADIVFHSATKYLNGHSDLLAGSLVTRDTNARWDEVQLLRTKMGAPLAPFESWMLMRGMRTLFVRYRQASANAMAVARHFAKHPKLEAVLYPGLATHPGHDIAKRQMTDGFGGMLSFLLKTDFAGTRAFCTRLKVIIPATSLGGVESLAEHRKTVEGPSSPVPDNLVRLSIGIENVDDLIADLEQALTEV
jgi:cystathionine gamma-synthase